MIRAAILLLFCAVITISALFTSCSHIPKDRDGTWTASWYGEPFHGRKTASGEVYDMYGVSAAHKHLPFGTRLHITNPENGRYVVVTINDRGPFVPGRDIDLSYGAARKLDMTREGVIFIDVRVLKPDDSYTREIANEPAGFAIQVASFSTLPAAQKMQYDLARQYPDARITTANKAGKRYHRVLVGRYPSRDMASTDLSRLRASGYSPLIREFF